MSKIAYDISTKAVKSDNTKYIQILAIIDTPDLEI